MACTSSEPIDRFALVTRHNISHSEVNPFNSLTVGNGGFAFSVDITGVQTFPIDYAHGIPLGTMSDWGWHSFPNPEGYVLADVVKYYASGNDSVPYYYQWPEGEATRRSGATAWLRENPHRLHLGMVGFEIRKKDGSLITLSDIENPVQQLNLWRGEIVSYFEIEGIPVHVITLCDQFSDRVAVQIQSELILHGRLAVKMDFPYPRHEKFNSGYDFDRPQAHLSQLAERYESGCLIHRTLNETQYYANAQWSGAAFVEQTSEHEFVVKPQPSNDTFSIGIAFSADLPVKSSFEFEQVRVDNALAFSEFWRSGGAVDFSESTDLRAPELERRVVLSQYLTKIQCTGPFPPQETGLTYNSWHGKFHLEMHWWHGIHFVLWQRAALIEPQLDFYFSIMDEARETAEFQGYEGVRWQKMIDPSGRESPSSIGVFLIWQQPHIIYFADLLQRTRSGDTDILEKYAPLVFETAEFMASYARFDADADRYVLGPALIPAQERFDPAVTINPAFELAYWHWGLVTAQKWRKYLGLPSNPQWQEVIDKLSLLPQKNGLYLFTETASDSYTNQRYLTDHPMVLGLYGILPLTPMVDIGVLNNSLDAVLQKWHWETCWGWDFPMAAMNAAALGRPELAVDLLLKDTVKNSYLLNGHNYQDEDLSLYLPGNGGLLTAVAMMCTFRDAQGRNGFPTDGSWKVSYENLTPLY